MKEFKGTPGPWSIKDMEVAGCYSIGINEHSDSEDNDDTVCGIWYTFAEKEKCFENAKLIAAAPEALDLLQRILAHNVSISNGNAILLELEEKMIDDITKVIDKAI